MITSPRKGGTEHIMVNKNEVMLQGNVLAMRKNSKEIKVHILLVQNGRIFPAPVKPSPLWYI